MDDDFNEWAPLLEPLSGKPYIINGKQANPTFDLEDISRRKFALGKFFEFLFVFFSGL